VLEVVCIHFGVELPRRSHEPCPPVACHATLHGTGLRMTYTLSPGARGELAIGAARTVAGCKR
jgi:hypothetical protein